MSGSSTSSIPAVPATEGFVHAVEAALKLRLTDRRFWLLSACGLFVTLTLTLVQARNQAFDTLQLMSRLMLIVECTLLLSAWLLASDAAAPNPILHSRRRRAALGFAGGIMLFIQLAVQLLPLLYFHQYPDLAKDGVHVPLMLLQRGLLLVLVTLAGYHLMLGLSLQLRLLTWLAAPAVLLLHAWASLSLTKLSLNQDSFKRLNDLFYWNQLWLHLPDFPKLQTDYWTHNMEGAWLAYYLLLACGLAGVTLLLWLPAALLRDSRETKALG